MKYTFLLSILIFFTSVLDASYARSIRVNSYTDQNSAQKALENLEIFIDNNSVLKEFQNEMGFQASKIKSGKYYMLELKPFTNKQKVQKTLDILRKKYSYVYPKKIKLTSNEDNYQKEYKVKETPKIDRTDLINKIDNLIQDSDMSDISEKRVVEPSESVKKRVVRYPELPLDLPMLKYTYLSDNNIQSEQTISVTDQSDDELTLFKEYIV